jgi:hypothetical protein
MARAGELGASVYLQSFKPSVHGFSTIGDSVDRNCRLAPPSTLPREAWHGYMVTIAHHEEVGVSADGHAGAPPSGAAAAGPPTGAVRVCVCVCEIEKHASLTHNYGPIVSFAKTVCLENKLRYN